MAKIKIKKKEQEGVEAIANLMSNLGKKLKGPSSVASRATSFGPDLPLLCNHHKSCLLLNYVFDMLVKLNLQVRQP